MVKSMSETSTPGALENALMAMAMLLSLFEKVYRLRRAKLQSFMTML